MNRLLHKLVARFRINPLCMAMPGPRLTQRIGQIVNAVPTPGFSRLRAACLVAACVPLCAGFLAVTLGRAQSAQTDWEKTAGGRMAFDVASIKRSGSDERAGTNVGLDSGNDYKPSGGLFRAVNFAASTYIGFAYKLTHAQRTALEAELPKWANDERFDIEARTSANATKDQMRLMMQSLLFDRCKLAVHAEKKQMPTFALVLAKPGRLGPHLRHYEEDPPCSLSAAIGDTRPDGLVGGLPAICDNLLGKMMPDGHASFGARNETMQEIADGLPSLPNAELNRPVVDGTGLTGSFDFWLEMGADAFNPPGRPPASPAQSDDAAPGFVEMLRDQLGLKLEPTTGLVDVLVIDHIEEPAPN